MNKNIENEKGIALIFTIIAFLIVLLILPFLYGIELGPIKKGPTAILIGIYIQFWGILFLLSYFFSHKTFFFRGLMWICENFSSPKNRKMAFIYFGLAFGLGSISLITGLGLFSNGIDKKDAPSVPPGIEPIENWWYKDPLLYIVLFIIIGVIYYRYKTKKY